MKETFYFSHDYHARDDEKIINLIKKEGYEGYGLYWALIEMLYEADGFLTENYDNLAFALRTDCDRIASVVKNYGLFTIASKKIHSKSCLARLAIRKGISEKNRQNAVLRWNKQKKEYATALRPLCEGNANKVKESKVKESKYIAETSSAEVIPDLLNDKQKHIQIIGLFSSKKNIAFTSKEHQSEFIKRNLRPAQALKPYTLERIAEVMDWLNMAADYKWTLESVGKTIDENLDNLTNRQSKIAIIR